MSMSLDIEKLRNLSCRCQLLTSSNTTGIIMLEPGFANEDTMTYYKGLTV